MGCLMKDSSVSIKVLNQQNLQQLCMDMVYSTICSSEFSERGWVKQQKWTFFHFYANSIHFLVHLNVYLLMFYAYFFHRDGRLCDIKILSFKFSEASG